MSKNQDRPNGPMGGSPPKVYQTRFTLHKGAGSEACDLHIKFDMPVVIPEMDNSPFQDINYDIGNTVTLNGEAVVGGTDFVLVVITPFHPDDPDPKILSWWWTDANGKPIPGEGLPPEAPDSTPQAPMI